MRGVVRRQVDREAGLDGGSDQATILVSDSIAEDGLVGEGDHHAVLFARAGGMKFVETGSCLESQGVWDGSPPSPAP